MVIVNKRRKLMGLAFKMAVLNRISVYTERLLRITCQLVLQEIVRSQGTEPISHHVHKELNKPKQIQLIKVWGGMLVEVQVHIGTNKIVSKLIGRQACSTWAPKTSFMAVVVSMKSILLQRIKLDCLPSPR